MGCAKVQWKKPIYLSYMNHRTIENPKLEGTHKDNWVLFLASNSTTQKQTLCLSALSKFFWNSSNSGQWPLPCSSEGGGYMKRKQWEANGISPMLFCFYTHGLSNSALLYMVNKGCVSQRSISFVLWCISGVLLPFPSGLLYPGVGIMAEIQPKLDLLRENPFVFLSCFSWVQTVLVAARLVFQKKEFWGWVTRRHICTQISRTELPMLCFNSLFLLLLLLLLVHW